MNSILITGLAIGTEPGIDACESCNYDLLPLLRKPSTLLWADKIVLTEGIKRSVDSGFRADGKPEFAEVATTFFGVLEEKGLLDVRRAGTVITPDVRDSISREIVADCTLLLNVFPKNVTLGDNSRVPGQIFVDTYEYCFPALWSLYASLQLAEKWGANILLSSHGYNYFRFKFGLHSTLVGTQVEAFEQVFSTFLPEGSIIPRYLQGWKCAECNREDECRLDTIPDVERNIREVLTWRDYDEFHEMRQLFTRISARKKESASPAELVAEFTEEGAKIRRKVNLLFPKVERWTNLATIVSIPTLFTGVTLGLPALSVLAGAVGSIAKIAEEYIKYSKRSYEWLGFRAKTLDHPAQKRPIS